MENLKGHRIDVKQLNETEIDLLYFIVQRYIGKCNKVRFDLSELTPEQQEDWKVELNLLKKLERL